MSTIRRLYFYAMSLFSVLTLSRALHTIVDALTGTTPAQRDNLPVGLGVALVALPVFLLHWTVVQRDARRDGEEASSLERAVFLYAALSAYMGQIIPSLLGLLNRALLSAQGQSQTWLVFGNQSTVIQDLTRIGISLLFALLFTLALRREWQSQPPQSRLGGVRRLFRLAWMTIGLGLSVMGLHQIFTWLFHNLASLTYPNQGGLSAGLALVISGLPLWAWFWHTIETSLTHPEERSSNLRQGVLYAILLVTLVTLLLALINLLSTLLEWRLGHGLTLSLWTRRSLDLLAVIVPFALAFFLYNRVARRESGLASHAPALEQIQTVYSHALAAFGLASFIGGLVGLIRLLVSSLVIRLFIPVPRDLSYSLALALVGVIVWLSNWNFIRRRDQLYDRGSLLRRLYLYLVIFVLTAGTMSLAGLMFYTLFSHLLKINPEPQFLSTFLERLGFTLTGLLFLFYHLRALQEDLRAGQAVRARQAANYPALLLADDPHLAESFRAAMARYAPRVPLVVHLLDHGAPSDDLLSAKVVVLPARLALEPPEPLRLWLAGSRGRRLILPLGKPDWNWIGLHEMPQEDAVRTAVTQLRQLAEGETMRLTPAPAPAVIAGWILAGLASVVALAILYSLITNLVTV